MDASCESLYSSPCRIPGICPAAAAAAAAAAASAAAAVTSVAFAAVVLDGGPDL